MNIMEAAEKIANSTTWTMAARVSALAGAAALVLVTTTVPIAGKLMYDSYIEDRKSDALFKTAVLKQFGDLNTQLATMIGHGDVLRAQDNAFNTRLNRVEDTLYSPAARR